MERLHGLDALPVDQDRAVVTVGFFDGVHLGHRAVLGRTVEAARDLARANPGGAYEIRPIRLYLPGSGVR